MTSLSICCKRALPLAILLASCAAAHGQASSHKALFRALDRAFARKKSTDNYPARKKLLRKMRGVHGRPAIEALVRSYERLDAEAFPIRKERGEVLDTRTSLELVRFRKRLDPIDILQDSILELLDAQPREHADDFLELLIAHTRKPERIVTLMLALARKSEGFRDIDALRRTLARPLEPGPRVAFVRVVEGLGKRMRVFLPWLRKQLEHESESLQIEAVRALGASGDLSLVPLLVARMPAVSGRPREEIARALHRLTGLAHGMDAKAWRDWLDSLEDVKEIKAATGTVVAPPELKKMGEYFTIAQQGKSIHYVLDRSDSMERGLADGSVRIRRARKELARAVRALDPSTRFNIISFSIKVRPWESGLQIADKKNVARARKWIFELDLQAGTSSYDALERSFRLAGCRSTDRFDELEIETMFFLSDGEPTRRTGGRMKPLVRDDPKRILSAVRRWNPLARVQLHTIGLALQTSSAPMLMRGLAEEHGGIFVAIR